MVLKIVRNRKDSEAQKVIYQTEFIEGDDIKVEQDILNKKIWFDVFTSKGDDYGNSRHTRTSIDIGDDDAYIMEGGHTIDSYRTWTNKSE